MRPLISILCLAVATHCWAEDKPLYKAALSTTGNSLVQIPVTSDSPEAKQLVNLGLQHFLLGEAELACSMYQEAVQADSACILAHAGILITTAPGSPIYKEHLSQLNSLLPGALLTPVEEWYLSTLLQYASGDFHGTAAALKERAALYRRDIFTACWDIILNHHAGNNKTSELTGRADALIRRYPENGMVNYCRALLEEHSSSPTNTALTCSRKATKFLSASPVPYLLAGRLQYNSSNPEAAAELFQQALDTATPGSVSHLVARLSHISALISIGNESTRAQAIQEARKIAQNTSSCALNTPAGTLQHWEGKTLLLRLLVLQSSAPAGQAINTAAKACNTEEKDPLYSMKECLVEAIRTRCLAESNRKSIAIRQLSKAEKHYQDLLRAGHDCVQKGGMTAICMQRATQACMAALYRAKIALYPGSKDIWTEHLNEVLNKPQPRFLPPVLPQPNTSR